MTRSLVVVVASALLAAAPSRTRGQDKVDPAKVGVTESGLQFKDLVVGNGAQPVQGQTCAMHYTGWLWEGGRKGKKFDSSLDRGEPFQFPLGEGRVIRGWDEGVASMKVGGKRILLIPPALGYGEQGAGGAIPPNATLVFEVELLGVDGGDRLDPSKMTKGFRGLRYMDQAAGTGPQPQRGQTCVMHYTGWLWEDGRKGKRFDSSHDRGEPFSFPVGAGRVIKGWDEGVASMKVGGKRLLLIPPGLAYGSRGVGNLIPPRSTLLFEVELLDVK